MGKEIAILYAKEGAKVIVSDINDQAANAVVQEIKAAGGEATAVLANVAKEGIFKILLIRL
ncbi:MAG TPA: SDR family NAD(P)-dependent oxidoreductase [Metabacillus sp.]|nr:SDR family NAD(P)-dependent oxidoreductase [Metabacillus sp.]